MQKSLVSFIFTLLFFGSALHSESSSFQDLSSKVSFPKESSITYEGNVIPLTALGSDTRTKFFARVYAIAAYMEDPQDGSLNEVIQQVLTPGKAKQVRLNWLRSVSRNQFRGSIIEAVEKNIDQKTLQQVQKPLDQFIATFKTDIRDGDSTIFNWLPNGTLEIYINGNKAAALENEALSHAVFSMWFGVNSVVDKSKLLRFVTQ